MANSYRLSETEFETILHRLGSNDEHLIKLDLSLKQLGDERTIALAAVLGKNTVLTSLDLARNDISSRGGLVLAEALQSNSTLTSLALWTNRIGDAGAIAFGDIRVDLEQNKINDQISRYIDDLVAFNQFLIKPSRTLFFKDKSTLSLCDRCFIDATIIGRIPFQNYARQLKAIDFRNLPKLNVIPANLGHLDPNVTRTILLDVQNLLPSMRPFGRHAKSIIHFAKALLDGTLVDLNQVKLMVVGRAATGKTTLVRRFYGSKYDGSITSTDGIDLGDFVYQGMRFSTWDFGGQKVYRYTHQLFLGDGSTIYLILFKLTDGITTTLSELRFWLSSISARAKHAAIFLVGTHLDQVKKYGIDATQLILTLKTTLAQEFPNLIDPQQTPVHQVSCVPGGERSTHQLLEQLVAFAQRVSVRAPKSFATAEQYFAELASHHPPVIHYHTVMAALTQRLPDHATPEIHATLLILADFGSISVFHQPHNMETGGLIVFRPQWITTLFSSIITTKHTFIDAGTGTIDREVIVQQLWKDPVLYPPDKHADFLHVLTELQVIFPFVERGREKYFIPCRLREELPDLVHYLPLNLIDDHPFFYHRIFRLQSTVPIAVIPPLLIELMRKGELRARWQQGCVARLMDEEGGESVWVHLWRSESHSIELKVWTQSMKKSAQWLRWFGMLIDTRLTEFYHLPYQTRMPCSRCALAHQRGHVTEAAIHQAILNGHNMVACEPHAHHKVRVDRLAPDILFRDFQAEGFLFDFQSFQVLKVLGQGAYGKVYLMAHPSISPAPSAADLARPRCAASVTSVPPLTAPSVSTTTLSTYAVKTLEQGSASTDDHELLTPQDTTNFLEFKREVFLMSTLRNPYVVKLYGICTAPPALVMEVVEGGDLYGQLNDPFDLQPKIYALVTAVKSHLTRCAEGPRNIQRPLFLIEHATKLPVASLSRLKAHAEQFLQSVSDILQARGRSFTGCPLQFLIQLKQANPRDPILDLLQAKFGENHLGLDRDEIVACFCPKLLPLAEIDPEEMAKVRGVLALWRTHAAKFELEAPVRAIESIFFQALEEYHRDANLNTDQKLDHILEEIQLLEQSIRETLVPMPVALKLKLAAEIAYGMTYLHSLDPAMVHRDLKSPNIFLTRHFMDFPSVAQADDPAWSAPLAKVADFGLSVRMMQGSVLQVRDRDDHDQLLNIKATWAAPELLRGQRYTTAVDVYAMGIILWELLVRDVPFADVPHQDFVRAHVLQGGRPSIPEGIGQQPPLDRYVRLMQACWAENPVDRPTMPAVYAELLGMIDSEPSLSFLKACLPPPSEMSDALPIGGTGAPQVQSISIPNPEHITCMIAPFQTEEFWLGFAKGAVGYSYYDPNVALLRVLLCHETEKHQQRVNAIVYASGQGHDGTIWSGSEDGLLNVWAPHREDNAKEAEHLSFKAYFVLSNQKQRRINSSSNLSKSGGEVRIKKSAEKPVWIEFEYNRLYCYSSRSILKPKLVVDLGTDVAQVVYNREAQQIEITLKKSPKKKTLILSSLQNEATSAASLSECHRKLATCLSALQSDHQAMLKRLAHRAFSKPSPTGGPMCVGIQALLPLDHSILCATSDFFISEWTLSSTADEHGLHETFSIQPIRSIMLDIAPLQPRLRFLLGCVRVNARTVWLAVGNQWVVFDLQAQQLVPLWIEAPSPHSPAPRFALPPDMGVAPPPPQTAAVPRGRSFAAAKSPPRPVSCSSTEEAPLIKEPKLISMLFVRREAQDYIYTGDEIGQLLAWKPILSEGVADAAVVPLLVPHWQETFKPTSTNDPIYCLVHLAPDHLWLGTKTADLISWHLPTQSVDPPEFQPFANSSDLRPEFAISALLSVPDRSNTKHHHHIVWSLSRDKKFLRFDGVSGSTFDFKNK